MKIKLTIVILIGLIGTSLFNFGNVEAKEKEVFYLNNNNVEISTIQYDLLLDLGFTPNEIETLTMNEFSDLKELIIVSSENTEKYEWSYKTKDSSNIETYKTEILEKEQAYILKEKIKKYKESKSKETAETLEESESINLLSYNFDNPSSPIMLSITEENNGDNCDFVDVELTCYTETSIRKMTTNIAVLDSYETFVKITIDWLTDPSTTSYDLIGFSVPDDIKVVQNSWRGRQTYTYEYRSSSSDQTIQIFEDYVVYDQYDTEEFGSPNLYEGVILRQDLVDCVIRWDGTYYVQKHLIERSQSVWAKTTTYQYLTYPVRHTLFTQATEYSYTGSYKHAETAIRPEDLSFGISSAGVISVSGSESTKYDYGTHLSSTIYSADIMLSDTLDIDIDDPLTSEVNMNDVFVPANVKENLIKMGFDQFEISYLTQEEVDKFSSYEVIRTNSKENDSSSYKRMVLTASELTNGNFYIKLNMLWETEPSNRDWDVIGIKTPSYSIIEEYYGKQIYKNDDIQNNSYLVSSVINYPQTLTSYFSQNSLGVVMKHNLKNDVNFLFITLAVEGSYTSSTFVKDCDGYFMHMTSYDYLTNNEFWMGTTGILFNSSTLANKFDTNYYIRDLLINYQTV